MHIALHGRNIQCEARLSEPALVVVSPMQHPTSPTAAHHQLSEHHGKHSFNCEQTPQQTDLSTCTVAIITLDYQSVSYCCPSRSRPRSKPASSAQSHWLPAALPQTDAETSSKIWCRQSQLQWTIRRELFTCYAMYVPCRKGALMYKSIHPFAAITCNPSQILKLHSYLTLPCLASHLFSFSFVSTQTIFCEDLPILLSTSISKYLNRSHLPFETRSPAGIGVDKQNQKLQ